MCVHTPLRSPAADNRSPSLTWPTINRSLSSRYLIMTYTALTAAARCVTSQTDHGSVNDMGVRSALPVKVNQPLPVVALMLGLSALCATLAIWQAISPYALHAFYAVGFTSSGRIWAVYPAELPVGVRVAVGDRVIERPNGDVLRGYRLRVPMEGDTIHVLTARGTVVLRAARYSYARREALAELIRQATGAIVILCAALLFARRPGVMAFAFWLWAVSELGGTDLDWSLDWLPRPAGLTVSLLFQGLSYSSGLALISFALRFPSGKVAARWRWLDRAAWALLCGSAVAEVVLGTLYFAGRSTLYAFDAAAKLPALLPVLVAAGILLWKQVHAPPVERPRIAWASAGFVGAAVARAVAFALNAFLINFLNLGHAAYQLILALSNVLPLLAIYPILRYRLFDLGFIVNRAALYSTLTLAAFGTLAGANWLAQHFVTDRLAFIMQPVAAIAIGLFYFRVRAWAQSAIERVLFRDRFATEAALEATIRGLPFVERAQSVDDVLVTEVAGLLRLGSAALFALSDHGFQRGTSLGWTGDLLTRFPRDDTTRWPAAFSQMVRSSGFRRCTGSPRNCQRRQTILSGRSASPGVGCCRRSCSMGATTMARNLNRVSYASFDGSAKLRR
jgi:hypothetical protein